MTSITRAITLARTGLLLPTIKNWAVSKLVGATVALVEWALSKHQVQRAVAEAFSGHTPMCRVLEQAVESSVEEMIKNRDEIEADDVEGLDVVVEKIMDQYIDREKIVDEAADEICRRLTKAL